MAWNWFNDINIALQNGWLRLPNNALASIGQDLYFKAYKNGIIYMDGYAQEWDLVTNSGTYHYTIPEGYRVAILIYNFEGYEGDGVNDVGHILNFITQYRTYDINQDRFFVGLPSGSTTEGSIQANWRNKQGNIESIYDNGNHGMLYPTYPGNRYSDKYISIDPLSFDTNIPVFIDSTELEEWLRNPRIMPEYERNDNKIYTIKNRTYETDYIGYSKTELSYVQAGFVVPRTNKIWGVVGDGYPYNITLHTNASNIGYYTDLQNPNPTPTNLTSLPALNLTYTDTITNGEGGYAFGYLQTNIPIFANNNEGTQYANGQIDEGSSLNNGGFYLPTNQNYTGTPLTSTDDLQGYDEGIYITNQNGANNIHVLDTAGMRQVFAHIYSQDDNTIEAIKKGLYMYGANPIECISDCYYLPIDISQFCATTQTDSIKLGGYTISGLPTHNEIVASGKIKTIVNTMVQGTYGDYRDYSNTNLYLYLYAVGIVPLDVASYINKLLTIKCTFDVRSHNLQYWVFADNQLVDEYTGSVGANVALMGTDFVGKHQQNIKAIDGIRNLVPNPMDITTGNKYLASADLTTNTMSGLFEFAKTVRERPSKNVVGSMSSAIECYGIKYPFLVIETQETEEPSNLKSTYGKPTNSIGKLSNYSGFVLWDKLELESEMSETERQMLASQAANGIYI